jgi:hypothetical protein
MEIQMKNEAQVGWFLDSTEMGKTTAYLSFLSKLDSIPKSIAEDVKELTIALQTKRCEFYEKV